jgi:hypothetical protein
MSEQGPTLYPLMRYTDAPAAIEFLKRAFAFRDLERIDNPDGTIAHAGLSYGSSVLMLGSDRDVPRGGRRVIAGRAGSTSPSPTPTSTAGAPGRREPRSSPSPSTPTTARGTTARETWRATNGTSGPTVRHLSRSRPVPWLDRRA